MSWQDRVIGTIQGYKVVDLFPYKIRDVNNFLDRDIPPLVYGDDANIEHLRSYWRRAVEGWWVNDNGRLVWMPPKAFFYANLSTVVGDLEGAKTRGERYPDLRDTEWIGFSYILCVDGWSGFELDDRWTSNELMLQVGANKTLPPRVIERVERACKVNGKWKEYVPAWDYLTKFYLVDDPPDRPLGMPLYDNPSHNGVWMASRKTGKTYTLSAGDAAHTFWTNGARRYEDLKNKRLRVSIFVGSSDSNYLSTFMSTLRTSFVNIPGIDKTPHDFFTRAATEGWHGERDAVVQKFRKADGSFDGSFSEINKAVILQNKAEAAVSKRVVRGYVDEMGLQGNIEEFLGAIEASMTSDSGKFGSFFGSGTGGNIEKFQQTKKIITNPKQYDIYSIPNYWGNGEDFVLFLPYSYTLKDYKDRNGNTDLMAATQWALDSRAEKADGDMSKITFDRMNYPLEPKEMFLSGKSGHFDKDLITDRIGVLEDLKEFRRQANIYELDLGPTSNTEYGPQYTVIPRIKEDAWNNVVMGVETYGKATGELLVFEPPMPDGREFWPIDNLYKVCLDPKQDLDTGESYFGIVVYKGMPRRPLADKELFNTVVASAKIKDDGLKLFMMLCLWYKSRGQYERNVSGIPDFFAKYGLRHLLQPTPYQYIKDSISASTKQQYDSGIYMTTALKAEGRALLKKHHRQIYNVDENGRVFRQIEAWYDLPLLYEMNFYDPDEGNYDLMSAMYILMLWLESEFKPLGHEDTEEEDTSFEELASTAKKILGR